MLTIQAKKRDLKESVAYSRAQGFIPAVYYGPKTENVSITIPLKEFTKVWKEAGETSAIIIKTDSGDISALIHDVSIDPVTSVPKHADFYVIDANKELEINVPIEFVGISPAVKGNLGSLVKVMHELEIKALPKNLPHNISVDLSSLVGLDSQILAGQVILPSGVTLLTKEGEVIVAITAFKEEEVIAPVMDLSKIEVEKKGKKEEEEPAEEAKK